MKKKGAAPVTTRTGNMEFLKLNTTGWAWRDAYHWTLTLSWPRFSLFLLAAYLGVNIAFALLFLLANKLGGGVQIAEMPPDSFADAFFFSAETLATVGYGHMYPVGLYGHLVATAEIIVGMFGMAVVTGLIFVRFSRPAASLKITHTLVLSMFKGLPALMFRVANQRHQPMMDAQFRLMMIRTETVNEGEEMSVFYDLPLHMQNVIVFPAAMTIRHVIDERSPLHGATPESLERCNARFTASVICTDTVVAAAVQSHQTYSWQDVHFGERFVEIYRDDEEGRLVVDYGRLHETEPAAKSGKWEVGTRK